MNISSKQDSNGVRTAQDLERKYDFASLLGLKKNVQMHEQSLMKVSNELNNMLNSLIINLADVLDSQSEISLWFFSGVPTQSNKPYIDWENKEQHYGDLYYDQLTGYVYKYTSKGWSINEDINLIQAMALTNVELDVTVDHERKVYFTQPQVPYSSGDWWILEDGTLKICQLGKTTGNYDSNDFVVSSKYTSTIATKTDNTITVLKGTVTTLSENAVTFEDLSTGGKTSINGANIDTGNINTDNVSIGNGNVTINKYGILLNNGAKVVGEYGMFTNLQFNGFGISETNGIVKKAGEYNMLGFENSQLTGIDKFNIYIDVLIPENFKIETAYITLRHIPYLISMQDGTKVYGYSRNIKCYVGKIEGKIGVPGYEGSEYYPELNGINFSEISKCFDTSNNTFTPVTPTSNSYKIEEKITNNIASQITKKARIKIATINSKPTTTKECFNQTGFVFAQLNVYGYMQYK